MDIEVRVCIRKVFVSPILVTNNIKPSLKNIHYITKKLKNDKNFERDDIHETYFTAHGHLTEGLNKKILCVTNNIIYY